ncbi:MULTISPECIES: DUF4003 family protein [unclassified Ruminococcus]|uniref:DUF4003 family protein n=1 Tax=unclassified Ruminococcus TaxID=2608920 RepID=UPI00210F1841|nr:MULTISPECIES: DUF4003 family protein [unclassified Ruminococcus]MCQ4021648.1 DUF4003 family protein [Ruminococcus sp. zg-924]MCQ4114093.1 DUF4003 family protein [Ruminococcus sp. zg-921]
MVETLLARCELFARNLEMMKQSFKWESSQLYPLCANIYTQNGIELEPKRIKTSKDIIKENTNFFSNFRSTTTTILLATLLSIENNPQEVFTEVYNTYEMLKEVFSSSSYLTLAAYMIVKLSSPEYYESVTNQTREIFDMIKKEHFFLTSSEDCLIAVLFALNSKIHNDTISTSQILFEMLKPVISHGNTVQAISNILALSDKDTKLLADKTTAIIYVLRTHGYKLTSGVDMAVFGALAISDISVEQIVKDILEVNAYLLTVKGFGNVLTESKIMDPKLLPKRRLIHSAIIVLNEYAKKARDNSDSNTASELNSAELMATLYSIISFSPSNV